MTGGYRKLRLHLRNLQQRKIVNEIFPSNPENNLIVPQLKEFSSSYEIAFKGGISIKSSTLKKFLDLMSNIEFDLLAFQAPDSNNGDEHLVISVPKEIYSDGKMQPNISKSHKFR